MEGFGEILGPLWGEVFGWLGGHVVEPAGPPLIRYKVIDMEGAMEIEVGLPVAAPIEGDDRVIGGVLPRQVGMPCSRTLATIRASSRPMARSRNG